MAAAELTQVGLNSYLGHLYEALKSYGDTFNAQVVRDLRLKLEHQEITVACFGYVSSGKSRLLNALLAEENLLPVSPMSTSMNSVYIRSGQSSNVKREQFHRLCQDAGLESLELFWVTPVGLTFIDTPGMDSIESANKQAENPALLLADLVIYVTDFNRVESEVNFSFLKTLESRQIPYLLVINQIDKHVSLELSLADFKARLVRTLKQWNLNPLRLYFISLLEDEHPESQFEQLKKMLSQLTLQGAERVVSTVIRSAEQVINRHSGFFLERQEPLLESHLWVKEQAFNELETMQSAQKVEKQIKTLGSLAETIPSEIRIEIEKLLDNAPLFSFETRELIKHFLESRQPGFKAGFFGRSAKTKSEQDQRLQKLYAEMLARSEANLTWHLRTILAEIPARYDLSMENYTDQVSQMNVTFGPELLLQTIRSGAMVSGEYILNYTHDLTDAIKSVYWQSSKVWIERAQDAANLKTRQELPGLQDELEYHQQALRSLAELRKLEILHDKHWTGLITPWEQMRALFPEVDLWGDPNFPDLDGNSESEGGYQSLNRTQGKKELHGNTLFSQSIFPDLKTKSLDTFVRRGHPKLRKIAQDLKTCADLFNLLPGFGLRAESLQQRAARLEDNLFTVALFGAFSAGKSSLANALLGASVLPVSPNPTTATINKILPPTDHYSHGTAKVKLKSSADLTTDVLSSLAVFGLNAIDLNQALLEIPSLDSHDVPLEAKPHLSFLRAVARGQASLLEHLGEELTVGYSDFSEFVVQEDKACFVESIELYFSCPLTELGVVLVDTPGSNSTNARHTNVAFDYIKNADAVLFVTYYNNPFCKADAQFLSQLGKIKDAFEMDKLFFLVNAADLAQTPEELKMVLEHVEQSLRSCEIIRPRLFPVSSQLALLAKLASSGDLQPQVEQLYRQRLRLSLEEKLPEPKKVLLDSGLEYFETSFNSFIGEELINLAVESAEKEIQRNFQYVSSLLEASKSDASQRIEKLQHYRILEQDILLGLEQLSLLAEESSIGQELDELLYYVIQRLTHRYSKLFDRNFFSLMQSKVEHPKRVAEQCIIDFLQDIEVELEQEARATFLRTERFLQKSLERVFRKYEDFVHHYDPQCSLQNGYRIHVEEEPKFKLLSWNNDSFAKVPDLYKNPKDWVEGRGKQKAEEMLIKIIQPQIQAWVNDWCGFYKKYWNKRFAIESKELKDQVRSDVTGYFSGLATALGDGYDIDVLEYVRRELDGKCST